GQPSYGDVGSVVVAASERRRVRLAGRVDPSRTICFLDDMGDTAGSQDRGEPALGAPVLLVAGRQPRRRRPDGRQISAGRLARLRTISTAASAGRSVSARRPPNVVLLVMESVAARWAGLNGGLYDTTPILRAESSHGLVFDNFYAHIGRSSNSLAAILMSTYPK